MARPDAIVELIGDKELQWVLQQMRSASARVVLRPALRAALQPIYSRARELVPVRSGLMRKAIRKRVAVRGRGEGARLSASVRVAREVAGQWRGKQYRPGNIAHIVEHGRRDGSGQRAFLNPAMEQTRAAALSVLTAKTRQYLERHAERLAKRGKRLLK